MKLNELTNKALSQIQNEHPPVESRKDALMDEIEKRLQQQVMEKRLFSIRWTVV